MIINKSGGMASRAKLFHLEFSERIDGTLTIQNIDVPDVKGFFLLSNDFNFPTGRNDIGAYYNDKRDETYYLVYFYNNNPGRVYRSGTSAACSFEYNKETKTLTLNNFYQIWLEMLESMTLVVWW